MNQTPEALRNHFIAVMSELNLTEDGPDAEAYVDGHACPTAQARHVAHKALMADELFERLRKLLRHEHMLGGGCSVSDDLHRAKQTMKQYSTLTRKTWHEPLH